MANSADRLRANIQLTSPDGQVFTPYWRGDPRTRPKKLGIFNFPGVDGSEVQDLGTSAMTYNLTLFFEGDNHDLDSDVFMKAQTERGPWEVIHPVHGLKILQPMSFTPNDEPVESSNITRVDTEWIEPLAPSNVPSAPELQSAVKAQINAVNDVGAEQLNNTTFQDTAGEVGAFRTSVNSVVSNVEQHLESISSFSASITAEMEAIKRDIDNVLGVLPLDVISVAGQIQELIQLPARAIDNVTARLDAYQNFADGISFDLSPDDNGTENYNRVTVQECALTAVFCAVADISSTGALTSRIEAIDVIEANQTFLKDITDTLDTTQELFEGEPIDRQYYSQSQSYADSVLLIAQSVAYLLRALFDLKTEKRFTLDRDRNPIMVAAEEYGDFSEANLDLFLESNQIEGDEHLIMKKGRELVVYV